MFDIKRQGRNLFKVFREDGNSVTFTKADLKANPYTPDLARFAGGGPVIDLAEVRKLMSEAYDVLVSTRSTSTSLRSSDAAELHGTSDGRSRWTNRAWPKRSGPDDGISVHLGWLAAE